MAGDGMTPGDAKRAIRKHEMQLWIAIDKGVQAAAMTEITQPYTVKCCRVLFLGGRDMARWFDELMGAIEHWARENGCHSMEAVGRPGWKKIGAPLGYRQTHIVMQKELHNGNEEPAIAADDTDN